MTNAVDINGFTNTVTTNNHITSRGSDWLFSVCALMGAVTFVIMGFSAMKPRSQRLFHYMTAAMTLVATVAYFSMGSNLGWTAIQVEFERTDDEVAGNMRQIFYVRYIDWFLTTPLMLFDLLFLAAVPTSTILLTTLVCEVMVVCGLVGSLVQSTYKWGFFGFGCGCLLFVAFVIAFEGRAYAKSLGADIHRAYTICGAWLIFMGIIYPIAWGVSEGGNLIPPDSEAIFYGVLDILTKPVFGGFLLWSLRNIDITRLGINIRDAGPLFPAITEKTPEPANNGVTNGATNVETQV